MEAFSVKIPQYSSDYCGKICFKFSVITLTKAGIHSLGLLLIWVLQSSVQDRLKGVNSRAVKEQLMVDRTE